MNIDESLNKALGTSPEPDANARKRAINLAMTEFEAARREEKLSEKNFDQKRNFSFFKGFLTWLRPMGNNNPDRNDRMNLAHKKLIFSGLATSSLVVVGMLAFDHAPITEIRPEDPAVITERSLSASPDLPLVTSYTDAVTITGAQQIQEEAESQTPAENFKIASNSDAISDRRKATARQQKEATASYASRKEIAHHAAQAKATSAKREANMAAPARPSPITAIAEMGAPQAEQYRDRFTEFQENSVKAVKAEPVSTFSVDVDTAAYSFVRRSLNSGHLPPKDAVRVEELINYFDYDYAVPGDKKTPFQPSVEVMDSPWKKGNKLIHIGIKGYQLPADNIPRSNLVFLLDVSGSMSSPDKLPLVQQAIGLLVDNLRPDDTVAIVVYAGAAGTALQPTKIKNKQKILAAVQQLQAGGSTAGAQGIQLAYQLAEANFDKKAVNRIILATDGDFNVGITGDTDLKTLVERKRDQGIYLSVLGFGQGNYQDAMTQTLAQNGNGIAAYIDSLSEAQKVLVHEATSTLFPIASDVKIQIEFNPATVAEYRLIGYETRALNREDFNNNKIDAGDIGAGHTVTAIYEITPIEGGKPLLEPNRYQTGETRVSTVKHQEKLDEYAFLRIRYKLPGASTSQLIEQSIGSHTTISLKEEASFNPLQQDAGFATAVAGFGQLLRGSNFVEHYTYDQVIELAQRTKGEDPYGYRTEFIQLVRKAKLAKAL